MIKKENEWAREALSNFCKGLCKIRGYRRADGRVDYGRFFMCVVCGRWVPCGDAAVVDGVLRCPCCNNKLRTGSYSGKRKRRAYVIELDG